MRVVEAAAGGVVTTVVVVMVAARLDAGGDRLVMGAVAFLVAFLAVLLRSDGSYPVDRRKR